MQRRSRAGALQANLRRGPGLARPRRRPRHENLPGAVRSAFAARGCWWILMASNSEPRTAAADIRKGMPPRKLSQDAFVLRFLAQYRDQAFDHLRGELGAV